MDTNECRSSRGVHDHGVAVADERQHRLKRAHRNAVRNSLAP